MATRHSITDTGSSEWLAPGEVARLMNVDPKTVARWAKNGFIPDADMFFTFGGHRRFRRSAVEAQMNAHFNGRRT